MKEIGHCNFFTFQEKKLSNKINYEILKQFEDGEEMKVPSEDSYSEVLSSKQEFMEENGAVNGSSDIKQEWCSPMLSTNGSHQEQVNISLLQTFTFHGTCMHFCAKTFPQEIVI